MRRGITTAARAGLIGLALLTAGCGWFGGDDAADGPSGSPFAAPLGALARGAAVYAAYDIYNVIPNLGPLAGGQPVLLDGFFPTVSNAESIYTVFFGANAASYDSSFTPFFTGRSIYVLTPPGDAPGLVDVILRDTFAALDTAAEYSGYEYIDPFALFAVDPNQGPVIGGTPVELIGTFPVAHNISSAAQAYDVFFGANLASFDPTFDPVITAERMYVITPPGDLPGFVDVSVDDVVSDPPDIRFIIDGFRYLDEFDIIEVVPDAGPLPGGEQVVVIGLFPIAESISTIDQAYSAYNVYFGAKLAGFDATFDPVITSERMYVIVPPGDMSGPVDVTVFDVLSDPLELRVRPNGYEYVADIELTNVEPDLGFILGDFVSPAFNFVDKPITLTGTFPVTMDITSLALAQAHYTVYFGPRRADRIAMFNDDPLLPAIITANEMHVLAPVGEDVGPVDVRVELNLFPSLFGELERAYRYYSMYIGAIIPPAGPLAGGNPVEVQGLFLVGSHTPPDVFTDFFDTSDVQLIAAEQIYTVFFSYNNQALFDVTRPPDPVITAASIDLANKMYVSNSLFVTAPPGDMPGLVDIIVLNDLGREPRAISDPVKYEYVGDIVLTDVEPDLGFILGDPLPLPPPPTFNFVDTPVKLTGTFPVTDAFSMFATAAQAYDAYRVYFGNLRALFDDSVTPFITAENMYVLAPVGEDVGPVDVRVVPDIAPFVFAELERAYRYYSMYIGAIIPDSGPLSGGTPVEIQGLFVTNAIYDLTAAEQIYTVFFSYNNQALFDVARPPDPVISAASIDLADRMYIANSLYVAAPPGDAVGFVDVIVLSDLGREPRAISHPLKYEYTPDPGIGQWVDTTVQPNPVGKLPPGHLLVTVEVTGSIDVDDEGLEDAQMFIVPQGGSPDNPNHRIKLDTIEIVDNAGANTIWTLTNANLIDHVTGPDNILTDGHAALFILEEENDNIVGRPDDDQIDPDAEGGRHFIIDTFPPRMVINNVIDGDRGNVFFDPSTAFNSDIFTTSFIIRSALHPFDVPASPLIVATQRIPWDQSGIRRMQVDQDGDTLDDFTGELLFDPATNRAQIFYNTGSIANNFPPNDLRFNLFVTFEDVDVYTTLGIEPDDVTDDDLFNPGVTARQVAGFGFEVFPDTPPDGDSAEGVLGKKFVGALDDDVLVQWEIGAGALGSPNIFNITTTYETSEPDIIDASASDISPNLAAAFTVLRATWEMPLPASLSDPSPRGIAWTGQNLLMPIVFRGVDRAGNYFPRGDTDLEKNKLWTLPQRTVDFGGGITFDQIAGPLNIWWLVKTRTEFDETGIPASENTRTPNFRWQNASRPDPDTIPAPPASVSPGPDRLFSYRIWRVDPGLGLSREEARNGPYTTPLGWSGWSAKDFLTTSELQAAIEVSEGTWMLLVVIAADEAGNVEQWPLGDLGDISVGDPPIIVAAGANSDGNWRRWYVAPAEQVVETEVRPTFWHDRNDQGTTGVIDPVENVLGSIEIVPLSPRNDESVSVIFRIDVVPGPSISVSASQIKYVLEREGQVVIGPTIELLLDGQFTFNLPLVDLGDRLTRRPVHYVFRATAEVTDTNGRLIVDSTPANFKFVVVDNVAKFIEGRGDDQPIKELDRP